MCHPASQRVGGFLRLRVRTSAEARFSQVLSRVSFGICVYLNLAEFSPTPSLDMKPMSCCPKGHEPSIIAL